MDNKQVIREALSMATVKHTGFHDTEAQSDRIVLCRKALTALEHLTDTAALVERLEGLRKEPDGLRDAGFNYGIHKAIAIIKELGGE